MAQVSYGTITVSDLTDITDVYLEYAKIVDTVVRYQDIPSTTEWSEIYPEWESGYQIWIRQVTKKEGLPDEYGTPYLDKAVNQINNNFINLDNRLRNFFYPGDPSYSGAFAVSKSTADGLDVTDANTYGFNTRMSVASISMGYNKIPLLEMGILEEGSFNGIKLYSPIMDHSTISGNRLDATLTSEGLKLLKGGIEAGTYSSTTTDFIYLSTIDYNNTPTVNIGGNTSGWRQIIGSKFGVKNDGTLYAAGAHVDGDIIAQSLTISNGSNTYDAINAMNASTYAIAITNDSSNTSIVDPNTTTYLYPILYHGGVRIEPYVLSQDTAIISGKKYYSRSGNTYTEVSSPTGNPSKNGYYEIDYTHFIWYQDDDTIGTIGSAIDGGIIASYGHTYRVIFNLSDEEVGAVPTVQQLMVDPSKYITRTSDTGITIHPEVQTSTTILQLNDDGLDIVRNGASIAKYGVSARVGADNSSRFLINSASLQAYNNNNQKYFEVSENGLTWGSNTAATTTQVNTLNNYVYTHLTVDNEGVWISPDVGDNKVLIATGQGSNYKTTGTYIVNSSTTLASFTTDGVQIGNDKGAYLRLGGQELEFYGIVKDNGDGAKAKLRFTSSDGDFPVATYIEASEQSGIFYRASQHIFNAMTSGAVFLPGAHVGTKLQIGNSLEYYTYTMDPDGSDEVIESKVFSVDWNGNTAIAGALTVGGVPVEGCTHTTTSGTGYRYDYYKYSNGLMILTLFWQGTTNHYSSSGSRYDRYVDFSWGSVPFVDTKYTVSHSWHTGNGFSFPAGITYNSASSVRLFAETSVSGSASTYITMLCVGRWK